MFILYIATLVLVVGAAYFAAFEAKSSDDKMLLISTIIVAFFFASILMYFLGYEDGQIDALEGEIKYEKVEEYRRIR